MSPPHEHPGVASADHDDMADLAEDRGVVRGAAPPEPLTGAAWAAARAAARRAQVRVRDVHGLAELHRVCGLYQRVWREDPENPAVNAVLLQALSHSGNYVAGAYAGDVLVGACVGFVGTSPTWELHSHIAGVAAEARGRSVGFALKTHQRAWALERGITRVSWTFDPLVRRNAYFNITKLGARPRGYLTNFYGEMPDGINAGDESDRLVIEWRLDDERVVRACAGRAAEPDPAALRAAGAAVALDVGESGGPVAGSSGDRVLLLAVPPDIERLRGIDPDTAGAWRRAVRRTLGGLLAEGATVTGFARSGWYVVERRGM